MADPSIIADIDQWFVERLQTLYHGGELIPVYPPGAWPRDVGETKYPCYAMKRYIKPRIDVKRARSHEVTFTPSVEQQTITFPEYMHLDPVSGPKEWTVKPLPTPYELGYQIDCLAANDAQALFLAFNLSRSIPVPSRPTIGTEPPLLITPDGDPENLDDLAKPRFWTAQRYLVSNIWIDRIEEFTKPSIGSVDLEAIGAVIDRAELDEASDWTELDELLRRIETTTDEDELEELRNRILEITAP
jgi:hypothetical protein